jgi:ElaB/YqjD/DUF883 family membrane-anchored ribosome-binding protein
MGAEDKHRDIRKDVDAIRDDLNLLKADLVNAMRDLVSAGKEGSAEAREHLEEVVQQRLDALNAATEELTQRGRNMFEEVQQRAQEKPLQTLGIAVGIGFIAGMIFARK